MPAAKRITIAIDGYSSCGKSTLAKDLARALHYSYVDTGAMYRAVTLYALNNGLINGKQLDTEGLIDELDQIQIDFRFNAETMVSEVWMNHENVEPYLRTMEVNDWVSPVSAIPEVRRKMVALQKEMGKNKALVMDGRDIGTTVFPDAELKIFMTADLDIRTQRRINELTAKKIPFVDKHVKENLINRDHEDMTRNESPLRKADDAKVLDNSHLTREEQLQWALQTVHKLIHPS